MSEWISVEQQEPNDRSPVLVWARGRAIDASPAPWGEWQTTIGSYERGLWSVPDLDYGYVEVSHWQPLPEPPA